MFTNLKKLLWLPGMTMIKNSELSQFFLVFGGVTLRNRTEMLAEVV